VFHYLRRRKDLEAMARETFAAVASGVLKPNTFLRLPLTTVAGKRDLMAACEPAFD
jgi:hypothetical protein